MTTSQSGHVLVLGATGVVGSAATDHLLRDPAWQVTTAGRTPSQGARHVQVDLLDATSTIDAVSELGDVTHVVYAAYADRPTMTQAVAPNLAMLAHVLDGLDAAHAPLQRVVLIGGGKSYGEHLGPYKTPAKESDPRHLGPIFYNDQEDLLAARAVERFNWTVLRPDIVIGPGVGSPMNLLTAIGAYAALSKDAGVPLRFPGTGAAWSALHQLTDADLLAEAIGWALTADTAANEVFNVTNGDLIRWEHLWPRMADEFGLPTAPPQPRSLTEAMAQRHTDWDRLVAAHRLLPTRYDAIAASFPFAEAVWNLGYDLVQSTIKIRQAGFAGCRDSEESLLGHLRRLRRDRFIP